MLVLLTTLHQGGETQASVSSVPAQPQANSAQLAESEDALPKVSATVAASKIVVLMTQVYAWSAAIKKDL